MIKSAKDIFLLWIHVILIACTCVALQPFSKSLQNQASFLATRISLLVHLLRLLRRAPPPKSFSALVAWVRSVTGTTEAFYLLGDFILLSNPSATLMLVSQSILAVYHAASLANKVLTDSHMSAPKFSRMYAKLGQTQQQALLYMGLCDIGASLQLIASFLLMNGKLRLATNIFVYLNLLKGRYHGPESASYHHSAWELIGNKVHPYIGALGPLRAVLDRIEDWFCTPPTS